MGEGVEGTPSYQFDKYSYLPASCLNISENRSETASLPRSNELERKITGNITPSLVAANGSHRRVPYFQENRNRTISSTHPVIVTPKKSISNLVFPSVMNGNDSDDSFRHETTRLTEQYGLKSSNDTRIYLSGSSSTPY